MNYTSIAQSKKLLELGLDPKTSDCNWQHAPGYENYEGEITGFWDEPEWGQSGDSKDLPCWSLGALMDLLPPSIQTGEGMHNQYEINIRKYWGDEENLYQIAYGNDRGLSEEWHDMINTGEKENLFDATFEMVVWLIENSYIKTEKK